MSITRHFYIHLEVMLRAAKKSRSGFAPHSNQWRNLLVQWFPLELDLNDLDPTWQTDTPSIHSGFGADDCLISGEHYSRCPESTRPINRNKMEPHRLSSHQRGAQRGRNRLAISSAAAEPVLQGTLWR